MSKAKEFRDQSIDELKAKHRDMCAEVFHIRNKGKEEIAAHPHLLRQKKREIARLLTVIREKELATTR